MRREHFTATGRIMTPLAPRSKPERPVQASVNMRGGAGQGRSGRSAKRRAEGKRLRPDPSPRSWSVPPNFPATGRLRDRNTTTAQAGTMNGPRCSLRATRVAWWMPHTEGLQYGCRRSHRSGSHVNYSLRFAHCQLGNAFFLKSRFSPCPRDSAGDTIQ